jgi:hypothetical protein
MGASPQVDPSLDKFTADLQRRMASRPGAPLAMETEEAKPSAALIAAAKRAADALIDPAADPTAERPPPGSADAAVAAAAAGNAAMARCSSTYQYLQCTLTHIPDTAYIADVAIYLLILYIAS